MSREKDNGVSCNVADSGTQLRMVVLKIPRVFSWRHIGENKCLLPHGILTVGVSKHGPCGEVFCLLVLEDMCYLLPQDSMVGIWAYCLHCRNGKLEIAFHSFSKYLLSTGCVQNSILDIEVKSLGFNEFLVRKMM